MSDDRLERILDAAYSCFVRHGIRRTTMDDIAAAAQMSRAAVYQHVQNKDDAFRRLSLRLFDGSVAQARAAAGEGDLVQRLHGVLSVKQELALRLTSESPHAEELLGASARLTGDLFDDYGQAIHQLLVTVVADAQRGGDLTLVDIEPADIADLGLALAHGLENDISDPEASRRRLRLGIELLAAGLRSPRAAAQPG